MFALTFQESLKTELYLSMHQVFKRFCSNQALSVGGVMVSIDAFQALDPGSIPGHRTFFIFHDFPQRFS